MADDNKPLKYMRYAIGEIVLVVIGILIALQINNWNESRKEQVILNASLTALKLNLKEDIENLDKQINYNKIVREQIDFAFRIISLPEYENVPLSIYADSIRSIADERTFFPISTAFKSMESGAHFRWLKNQELTESIYEYYALVERFSGMTSENNQFVKKHMESFIYSVMEFGTFFQKANPYANKRDLKLDNTKILRGNNVFENALIGRKFRAGSEIRFSENAILNAQELINTIDKYLNNN
jgi:Family of unknown function (DUF6090)